MAGREQVLERMTLVRAGDVELEALYQPGTGGRAGMPVVFAAPHPRLGGSMESAVLAELVWVLARQGHPTLRFNYRGVGASPGEIRAPWLPSNEIYEPIEEAADLAAAVDQHAAGRSCAVVGYSFGAAVAAKVAATHPLVERAVLIAPPIGMLAFDGAALATSGALVSVICAEQDAYAPTHEVERALSTKVQVIAHATHGFQRGLSELGRVVAAAIPAP